MTEETLANEQEGEQPEATEPEVDYKAEVERLKAEQEEERKNLQRNLSDREAKLKAEQERNSKVDEQFSWMGQELAKTRDYVTYLANNQPMQTNSLEDNMFETPQQKPAQQTQIPTPTYEQFQQQQAIRKAEEEVKAEMVDLGLDPVKDWPEVANTPTPLAAVRKARQMANERTEQAEKEKEKAAEEEKKKVELEEKRKSAESQGELDQPSGTPMGSGSVIPTKRADFAKWVEGLTPEEYAKHKPDINRLIEADKIK